MDTTRHLKKFALTLAGVFIAIVAVIINLDQLYLMATVFFLIPLASFLVGRLMMRGLLSRRQEVPSCQEGELATVTLVLENTGRLPKLYLRAKDRLPPTLKRIGEGAPLLLQIAPGEAEPVSYQVEAGQRGAYLLGPTQVTSTDPLGFYTLTQTVGTPSEFLVTPTVLPLRALSFTGGGAWGQRDTDSPPSHGGGLDFHGVRDYQPGDELRRVHWRTTARTGKLAVMEYTQGTASDALVALDLNREAYAGTGNASDSALEQAIKIAASVCDYLLRSDYTVRVAMPPLTGPPLLLRSHAEMPALLERLARAQADSTQSLADMLTGVLPWAATGIAVLYITPDAGSPALSDALREYAAHGASLFGYALDKESFLVPAGKSAEHGAAMSGAAGLLSTNTVRVKKGDNLMQVMEGGSYARW